VQTSTCEIDNAELWRRARPFSVRGISVAGTPERGTGCAKVEEYVTLGHHHGHRLNELIAMIETVK
jgi:hypothetical protein